MKVSHIFRVMGGLTIFLGLLCVGLDRWLTAGVRSLDQGTAL
jgi:hypothetical protein